MSLRTRRGVSFSTSLAAALAAVSVSAAIWLSLQPHRLADLNRIVVWTGQWLHGAHLYGPGSDVDYPPWAIVTLSPLALVPAAILPLLWISCNLAALVFTAQRLARPQAVMFLLIAAGAVRTLNQFSLMALALAVAGTTGTGPLRPLWLGLSLMKPQIGAVFVLHALWRRQWKLVATASLVPLVLLAVYAARAHVSVFAVPLAYAQSIGVQYGHVFSGQTEITPWLRAEWPRVPAAALTLLVAALVFAPLARTKPLLGLALASLLSLRHLSYDLILLLPLVATLRGAALWVAVGLLIADPSAVGHAIVPQSLLAHHGDRFLLCVLWAVCAVRSRGTKPRSRRIATSIDADIR